jgi:hypothetical protein
MLMLGNPFVHSTLVGLKSEMVRAGLYRHCISEDYEFWLRAQMAGLRIHRTSQYGVLYRRHFSQYTKQANFMQMQIDDETLNSTKIKYQSHLSELLGVPNDYSEIIGVVTKTLKQKSWGFRLRHGPLSEFIKSAGK